MLGNSLTLESFNHLRRLMEHDPGDKQTYRMLTFEEDKEKFEKILRTIEPIPICNYLDKEWQTEYGAMTKQVRELWKSSKFTWLFCT